MRMGCGLGLGGFIGLRLQNDRRDLKLLDSGQQDAGDQPGQTGREHDTPEHQAGFRSVAGKRCCVPGVVGGVVNGVAVGQCHAKQNDQSEHRGGQRRQQPSCLRDGLEAGLKLCRIHHVLLVIAAEAQHATSENGVSGKQALSGSRLHHLPVTQTPLDPGRSPDSRSNRSPGLLAYRCGGSVGFALCSCIAHRLPISSGAASRSRPWTPDSGAGVCNIHPMLSTKPRVCPGSFRERTRWHERYQQP